jgi:ATP-dependent DNA helicase RecG
MILSLIAEATECDFKRELEKQKPVSWLKSVSAFANGIGGTLFFGVDNDGKPIGLSDLQTDADFISRKIKDTIMPLPDFTLTPHSDSGREILALDVKSGRNSPYYFAPSKDVKRAYIRVGNESIVAPDYVLHELILKGTNRTFDTTPTRHRKDEQSFSVLEATYRHRTRLRFNKSDYKSFGLVNDDGFLTLTGSLFTDQHIVYNARLFCTRWRGLEKGSIFDDAIDDKEYEGNLIHLLTNGCDFVKLHNQVRFEKAPMERVDKPGYSERAALEALVNALIHRDWLIQGAEVNINIYDDRLEISSPGGMYNGKTIQEQNIYEMESERRNPVIADLFHRMKYMERRGSGLKKIVDETEKLHGYSDEFAPQFYSTHSSFKVVLKNLNYGIAQADDGDNVGDSIGEKVGDSIGENLSEIQMQILEYMKESPTISARSIAEKNRNCPKKC